MIASLLKGESILWRWNTGIVIGRPNRYHNKDIFLLEATAGEGLDQLLEELSFIEEEVLAWGFDAIELIGRKGWLKRSKELGYDKQYMLFRKDLRSSYGR
jgi:hypothetical protein